MNPAIHKKYLHRMAMVLMVVVVFISAPSPAQADEQVYYNTRTHIIHKMSCHWGQICTRNCVLMMRSDAYRAGGRGCKVCGGVRGNDD